MSLSVLLECIAEVSVWGLFLLGMHERVLPNCQAHSGQHRKLEQDCCWVHIPKAENCKARSEHARVREVGTHQKAVKGGT